MINIYNINGGRGELY